MPLTYHPKTVTHLHIKRVSWLAFLCAGLLLVQVVYNYQVSGHVKVLAYATNVNRADLLSLTNQQRASVGLQHLQGNGALNQAAQAKANHMIAQNYWAHTAPDGTSPWSFFDSAGYDYTNAGENLAYGFLDSSGVVNGWMNSPGHRANILGEYQEVGFGYANGSQFQGGENTVVVALYGTPRFVAAATPAPATTAPAQPQASAAPAPASQAAPVAPTPTAEAAPAQAQQQPSLLPANQPTAQNTSSPTPPQTTYVAQDEQRISTASALASRQGSWPILANLLIITIAAVGFIATHLQLLEYAWHRGLRWAGAHPLTDAAVITSISLIVMTSASGYIR